MSRWPTSRSAARDAVVGEEREAVDLDGHDGLDAVVVVVEVVVDVVVDVVVGGSHRPRNVAAATSRASRASATSWTRKTLAPRVSAMTFVAIVPATARPARGRP